MQHWALLGVVVTIVLGERETVCSSAGQTRSYEHLRQAGLKLQDAGNTREAAKCFKEAIHVYTAGLMHFSQLKLVEHAERHLAKAAEPAIKSAVSEPQRIRENNSTTERMWSSGDPHARDVAQEYKRQLRLQRRV
uniref:Uncharacterized protein n=1 Tax=Lotharella oceanica TaxID=641309 RepID=A0A7S2TLY1_9EUKA|mmetsp:Transcript_20277/g.38148  ORF Transcript_20277/g.38148 Transcript_20277/m.38148 type:complete len:135 (+) Transcript_20277:88-492(+)|eukprot:CAMPEP_0170177132 /NCGR_PEP_ID=MMETSP0040_2-20121228/9848_1 /TAXON_ID=641309 /ORGANISM="Lotharella oceanica, Strain CCMP622" /LENGTH=134 /DNA_ID=CAMNT_0010419667 /DNA_START=81 /DNA_END=485 /DNA_ORIENTATION=+